MPNDRDAFLRAIAGDPDDDTVRLAYADWLEDNARPGHGDAERAEFVRLQISAANGTGSDRDLLRSDVLYHNHSATWRLVPCSCVVEGGTDGCPRCNNGDLGGLLGAYGELPAGSTAWNRGVAFRRGFVDSVDCTMAEVYHDTVPPKWARRVVHYHPTITKFVVTDRVPAGERSGIWQRFTVYIGAWGYTDGRPAAERSYHVYDRAFDDLSPVEEKINGSKLYPNKASAVDDLGRVLVARCRAYNALHPFETLTDLTDRERLVLQLMPDFSALRAFECVRWMHLHVEPNDRASLCAWCPIGPPKPGELVAVVPRVSRDRVGAVLTSLFGKGFVDRFPMRGTAYIKKEKYRGGRA